MLLETVFLCLFLGTSSVPVPIGDISYTHTLLLQNFSPENDEYNVILRVSQDGIPVVGDRTCDPRKSLLYYFNAVSTTPVAEVIHSHQYSIYKQKKDNPLMMEPIEVSIPFANHDICENVRGGYAMATTAREACTNPKGVTPAKRMD